MTNKSRNFSYDILDGEARINVKSSKLFTKKHGKYFDFLLKQTHSGCDYFLLVGYLKWRDRNPLKLWLIPSWIVTEYRRLTIGPNHQGVWKEFEKEFQLRPGRERAAA